MGIQMGRVFSYSTQMTAQGMKSGSQLDGQSLLRWVQWRDTGDGGIGFVPLCAYLCLFVLAVVLMASWANHCLIPFFIKSNATNRKRRRRRRRVRRDAAHRRIMPIWYWPFEWRATKPSLSSRWVADYLPLLDVPKSLVVNTALAFVATLIFMIAMMISGVVEIIEDE